MNLFYKILIFLQSEMKTPTSFGWFHCLCIFIMLTILTLLYIYRKENNEHQLKTVLGIYGIGALILEILKQLIWSFNYDTITSLVYWDYNWYAFPYQLCTTPIIVCIICLFLKKGKIRNSLFSFLTYVTILGSISTMIMPESCFVEDILVNIHTMYLHLGSLVVSIYLLMIKEVKVNTKYLKDGLITFIIITLSALLLDIIVYNSGILNGEVFNMFYISPYFNSTLPVFSIIQPNVPYLLYLLIYIIVISLGAFIMFALYKLILKIIYKTTT